jgi:hypothetical protein
MRIAKSAVASIVKEVSCAIWMALQLRHMPNPLVEMFKKIAEEFRSLWNFPNCIGSIDGKHIRLKCPRNSGSQFFNYKQFHSMVLQAVVDARMKFIAVDVGAYGKQSDGGVFRYSTLFQNLETGTLQVPDAVALPNSDIIVPHVFVGDEAYPLTSYLLKPYSRRTLDKNKAIFNYRLSRARRITECAFGVCASKWRVLNRPIETKVSTAEDTVKCITLLHNIIINVEGMNEPAADKNVNANQADGFHRSRDNNVASTTAKRIRDAYCEYFNSPSGSVPWQEEAI